jgi:hypothetical protein
VLLVALAFVWTACGAAAPDAGGAAVAQDAGEAGVAGGAANSEPPVRVTVSVSPDSATIGDRLVLSVTLDRAADARVDYPDVARSLSPFEVLDESLTRSETIGGRTIEHRDYAVAAFETGDLWLPGIELVYVTAEGDSGTVATDSLLVTIASVLPEVKEGEQVGPLDIKPPMELPRRVWPWVVAALVGAAIAVGAYFLRRWLRGRTREEIEKPAEPPRVPRVAAHVVAMERLDALERDDPIGHGDIPVFYVRVTEIVRFYIRDRFGVDAIDMTTHELAPAMRDARIAEPEVDWTGAYLAHADLAKFAGHTPSEERARSDLAEARGFVERTRLRSEYIETDSGGVDDERAGGEAAGDDEAAGAEAAGEVAAEGEAAVGGEGA